MSSFPAPSPRTYPSLSPWRARIVMSSASACGWNRSATHGESRFAVPGPRSRSGRSLHAKTDAPCEAAARVAPRNRAGTPFPACISLRSSLTSGTREENGGFPASVRRTSAPATAAARGSAHCSKSRRLPSPVWMPAPTDSTSWGRSAGRFAGRIRLQRQPATAGPLISRISCVRHASTAEGRSVRSHASNATCMPLWPSSRPEL